MSWWDHRVAAAGEVLREQRLHATVGMAGRQRADVTVQHPGTADAAVTVRLGRMLVYLHTTAAARRFAQVWQDGAADALQLAQHARRHPGPRRPPDVAEPSMVVHVAGAPAATRWLVHGPGEERADHLVVRIDELRFAVYDRYAFHSCAEVFLAAERAAHEHLPQVDQRAAVQSQQIPTGQEVTASDGAPTPANPGVADVRSAPGRAAAALGATRAPGTVRRATALVRRPRVAGIPPHGSQPPLGRHT